MNTYQRNAPTFGLVLTRHEARLLVADWVKELGLIEALSQHGQDLSIRTNLDRRYIQSRLGNLIRSSLISLDEVQSMVTEDGFQRQVMWSLDLPLPSSDPAKPQPRPDGLLNWEDIA